MYHLIELPLLIILSGELIVSKYVAESITMIAGRFGHEGLCQLRTEQFTINSPDINKVAMSLYDITNNLNLLWLYFN